MDGARALTGARYGVIVTIDEARQPQDFVSSGITADLHRRFLDWPDGPRLFGHLCDLTSTLRLPDLSGWVRALGFSDALMPSGAFQGTPMRHRGAHVGILFLVGKEDGPEFTSQDEEVLVLFASQAAGAIGNARTHRAEQRARADLEALVDTSPVGVVVFDARTRTPLSLNREAMRIAERLHIPGRSAVDLLPVLTCRFADGRDITLDELGNAERLHAEELVLSVPDGRSVTVLINVTPIREEDGEVVSVVVTMQDLEPLEELERSRAEFLGMVSHELRAPLTSIKGSAATVLGVSPAPAPAEMLQFFRIIDQQADHMRGLIGDLLDAGRIDDGTLSVVPEPADVADLVDQARNTFVSIGGRHAVVVDLPPDLPRVMADEQRVVQVLNNLFDNAARHSPGSSPIRVAAERDGAHVAISVADEGRGVAPDRLPHLFRKYAGAGDRHRATGGSGLGLAICKGLVEAHGGRIRAESAGPGRGARFTFTLPAVAAAGDGGAAGAPGAIRHHGPHGPEPTRILVVDDDPQTLRQVRNILEAAGYAPLLTGDPGELPRLVRAKRPQLVLLDLMLPGSDGIELMRSVPGLADLPVVFISGYGRDETIARALQAGAADYIVKPFSPTELTARIEAALRKAGGAERFVLGDLDVDYEQRRVTVAGRPVALTATEYELLRVLSINAGRVVAYESLLGQIWGERAAGGPALIRTVVKGLRRKLGDRAAAPTYLLTERGVGYSMVRPKDPQDQ